jgi:guanine deaminase
MIERGAAVIHCPLSNFYFGDGLLNVAEALGKGLTVGLGTDVAGGYSPSMLQAVRMAVVNSHAIKAAVLVPDATAEVAAAAADQHVLGWQQGLWLGTMGGAKALGMEGMVGSFAVGKEFDALVVDCGLEEVFDMFEGTPGVPEITDAVDRVLQLVEKFVHLGDDRNLMQVYVQGKMVGGKDMAAQV